MGDIGIQRVCEAATERKKYNDSENLQTIERILDIDFEEIRKDTDVHNHKDCYSTFTSSCKIERVRKKFENTQSSAGTHTGRSSPLKPSLRSECSTMDTSLCIFCQDKTNKRTYLVATLEVSGRILEAAKNDHVMRRRLAGVNDLVAADAKYHLQCYVQFNRKSFKSDRNTAQTVRDVCFEVIASEVSTGLARGDVYTLLDVWERYSSLLRSSGIDAGLYRNNRFRLKERLDRFLPGQIEFVPQLNYHQPLLLFSTQSCKIAVRELKKISDDLEDSTIEDDLKSL